VTETSSEQIGDAIAAILPTLRQIAATLILDDEVPDSHIGASKAVEVISLLEELYKFLDNESWKGIFVNGPSELKLSP
jgi:hypothetical protein